MESKDKGMEEAKEKWDKISTDEAMRAQRRAQDNYERDKESEKAIERDRGKEEGIKEGLEKGKLENQKQIALNMKNKGLDNKTIAEYLSIDINDLEKLMNN